MHIVVNSAAIGRFAPILDVPEDEWDETMRTNLKSVYLSCRAFIPRMVAAGGGVFVNISSVNAAVANPSSGRLCGQQGRDQRAHAKHRAGLRP